MIKNFRLIASVLILAVSCTVKEDRSGCPCKLTLDISDPKGSGMELSVKGWNDHSALFGVSAWAEQWPDGLTFHVPKGKVCYSVHTMSPVYSKTGSMIIYPYGIQAEPLFATTKVLYCSGDTEYDKVFLHKQFAVVDIIFGGGNSAGIDAISIEAPYNGLSLDDLKPVLGNYGFRLNSKDGHFQFILPRQGDGLISMATMSGRTKMKSFNLSEILNETGYSWGSEDLDDIWIELDLTKMTCKISIAEWEDGKTYDLTI